MTTLLRPLTYEELEQAREATTDRLELIEGEIVVTPAPSLFHQRVTGRLYTIIERLLPEQVFFAPVDVFLAKYSVVQPDLVVVLHKHASLLTQPGIEGAPDLVAKIVSPTTHVRDRVLKRDLYAQYGVPELWLVDPAERQIVVSSNPVGGRYLREQIAESVAVSATIPGLSVDLTQLFAPIPGT